MEDACQQVDYTVPWVLSHFTVTLIHSQCKSYSNVLPWGQMSFRGSTNLVTLLFHFVSKMMMLTNTYSTSSSFQQVLWSSLNPQSSGDLHRHCLLQVFTAGPFALEFSPRMYGETWKFDEQGLPFNLEARYSSAGRPDVSCLHKTWALNDFPYAEDGVKVWNAIVEYFDEYLRLYYSDDGSNDKLKVSSHLIVSHLTTATPGWG